MKERKIDEKERWCVCVRERARERMERPSDENHDTFPETLRYVTSNMPCYHTTPYIITTHIVLPHRTHSAYTHTHTQKKKYRGEKISLEKQASLYYTSRSYYTSFYHTEHIPREHT